MPLISTEKTWLADQIETRITHLALFTTVPTGDTPGTEATGGSPAYARKAASFSNGAAGVTTATATFDVPAGTYVAVGFYDAATAGNYRGWADMADFSPTTQDTLQVTVPVTVS